MLDTHQLRVFAAVAEELSFTRAAGRLFLTQSAVSHQVAKLEREVGCALLLREGRTVALTSAGQEMLRHGRRVFAALDEAMTAARAAERPDLGRLRIGATATACQYLIPEAMREFRESFPGYSLSITPGDSPRVTELLAGGEVDLGIVIRAERNRKLTYVDLFDDDLRFVVSPLHPWARAGRANRQQLGDQHMVLYSRSSATFRLVERYFLKMRVPLRDWTELGDMGAIKELVKLGLGVSVTAEWAVRAEVEEKSLVTLPLPGGRVSRSWAIAHLAGRALSPAEQTFIGLCESAGRGLSRTPARAARGTPV